MLEVPRQILEVRPGPEPLRVTLFSSICGLGKLEWFPRWKVQTHKRSRSVVLRRGDRLTIVFGSMGNLTLLRSNVPVIQKCVSRLTVDP